MTVYNSNKKVNCTKNPLKRYFIPCNKAKRKTIKINVEIEINKKERAKGNVLKKTRKR